MPLAITQISWNQVKEALDRECMREALAYAATTMKGVFDVVLETLKEVTSTER